MTGTLVGIDIGGTFTDVVVAPAGEAPVVGKHLTTHDDPVSAVVEGLVETLARAGVAPSSVTRVAHATTLATNTILERRGVDVAFVTTVGFRDMLTLGRAARVEEQRFDLMFDAAEAPVRPERCFEVVERLGADGSVLVPFDEASARSVAAEIAATPVEAVAICFLHSYVDETHERRMEEICREAMPGRSVVRSSATWPELREYERATTTLMSAYVGPVMERYLTNLRARLEAIGIDAPVHVMESSGGVMSAELAAQRAVYTIESGPAAGVMGALQVGRAAGVSDLISFDMGGTTAKAGLVRGGEVEVTRSFHVGGSGSFGGRREGSGIPIKAPAIDLAEVGSGGGSIAWVDDGGALRVGPRSAGSQPGPACYDRGGTEPTVTDADLVLGYLDPSAFAGGLVALRPELAEAALASIARPLGVDVATAALAVHRIANANMGAAVHVVTVQRGIDPRRFTLVASGGAGPMHAAGVADLFGIEQVLVPAGCGVGSAIGLLTTDMTAERARTWAFPLADLDPDAVGAVVDGLVAAACADLGLEPGAVAVVPLLDLRHTGQSHELTVEVPGGVIDAAAADRVETAFRLRYAEAYGASLGGPVEAVGVRVRVTRGVPTLTAHGRAETGRGAGRRTRPARFDDAGEIPTTVLARADVVGEEVGPLVIHEPGATTVVPPGWRVAPTATGDLRLSR